MVRLTKTWMIGMVVLVLGHPETLEAQFLDVPHGIWYEGAVSNLEMVGLLEGYPGDGGRYFRPAQLVTRAEFLRLCLRALVKGGLRNFLDYPPDGPPFPDVPVGAWFAPDVAFAKEWGVVDRELAAFEPNRAITRSEAVEMISRTMEPVPVRGYRSFSDVASENHHVRRVYEAGIVDGYGDGTFRPSRPLNRAEAAVVIEKAFRYLVLPPVIGLKLSVFSPRAPFLSEVEVKSILGTAGIRLNNPDSAVNLVRIEISGRPTALNTGVRYYLRRSHSRIRVWRERERTSTPMLGSLEEQEVTEEELRQGLELWVENTELGESDLILEARRIYDEGVIESERTTFRTYRSIVIVLGGEDQEPEVYANEPALCGPPSGCGIFAVGEKLYADGFDVWLFDEDHVDGLGYGTAYGLVKQSIENRGVSKIAVIGYSHGGGGVYALARALKRDSEVVIGNFELAYTAYVDAIDNGDLNPEYEYSRPPESQFHLNFYQRRSCRDGFGFCGVPIASVEGVVTKNISVNDSEWGSELDHYSIDDDPLVSEAIIYTLKQQGLQ